MERYTHLMVNGVTKKPPRNESVIRPWLDNLIEEINMEIKETDIKPVMEPIYSYIDKDGINGLTSTAIIETGYVALRVWEKEDDVSFIHLDMLLSSPLPIYLVIDSLVSIFGMYDGSYMLLDRSNDFKTIDYRSYP
jgi:hypothetical protein